MTHLYYVFLLTPAAFEDYDTVQFAPYAPERVRLELGVSPAQVSEYLAVIGDSADNVSGK